MNKHLPVLIVLLGFGLVGCQSAGYANTFIYSSPFFTKEDKLGVAVQINDFKTAKRYIEDEANRPDVNFTFDNSDSFLIVSTFNNNIEISKALLVAGANANYLNSNNINALTVSVRHDNLALSRLLVDYGATPDKYFWREVMNVNPSSQFIREIYQAIKGETLDNIYIGDSEDIFNSKAIVVQKDGSRYEGLLKDGKASGKGKFYYSDGTTSTGIFSNGALTDGTIELNGKITSIKDSRIVDINSAERLKNEYIKANNMQNSNEALKDAGEFVLGLALLPIYIVVETLSVVDWSEVASDLPEEYMKAKREQQRVNNAYKKGVMDARRRCNGAINC